MSLFPIPCDNNSFLRALSACSPASPSLWFPAHSALPAHAGTPAAPVQVRGFSLQTSAVFCLSFAQQVVGESLLQVHDVGIQGLRAAWFVMSAAACLTWEREVQFD